MIELAAIVFVFVVAVGVYLTARFGAAPDPAGERERLHQYLAWLEYRRQQAELHNYDEEMKSRIADELAAARHQLTNMEAAAAR
jgi:hypothetical protein